MKDENVETGTNAGRVFSAEIDKMNESIPQLETTPAGIRYLLEMDYRMGERAKMVHRLGQQYLNSGHRVLDRNFNNLIDQRLPDVFTDQERAHPDLIGAAEIPRAYIASGKTTPAAAKWVQEMKLSPDDPVRITEAGQAPYYVHAKDIIGARR